jgi:hypothetical protein
MDYMNKWIKITIKFFPQISSSTSYLEQLPQQAPHFTSCFLTAAAELYGGIGNVVV